MSSITLISTLHVFIAILQFMLAGLTFLSNRRAISNRLIAILLILLGLTSVSAGASMNAITADQATPWLIIQASTVYIISPIVMLTGLYILRPQIAKKRLVSWPILFFISLPLLGVFLDITGISNTIFNQHLVISISEISDIYSAGFVSTEDYMTGSLYPVIFIGFILFFMLAMVYPFFTVAIKDRKANPENGRFAWILFAATLISSFFSIQLQDLLPVNIAGLASNVALAIGFTIVGLQKSDTGIKITGFANIIRNFPMSNKLILTSVGIVLPSILIIGFSINNFFQGSISQIVGEDLRALAEAQREFIEREINNHLHHLTEITNEGSVINLVSVRSNSYSGLNSEEINLKLQKEETSWQDEESMFRVGLINPINNLSLRAFIFRNPEHIDFYIVDIYGGLITATKAPSVYNHSQQEWWQQYVKNNSEFYIGDPIWDEEKGETIIEIAAPIYTISGEQNIGGVLYSQLTIQPIIDSLETASENTISTFSLIDSKDQVVQISDDFNTEETILDWEKLTKDNTNYWKVINFNAENNIIGWADITSHNDEDSNLDWHIIASSKIDDALSSVFLARNGTYILMGIMLASALIISVLVARSISSPLSELTQTAEKILAGERDIQSEVVGEDEIGILAKTFNTMISDLNNALGDLETTVAERTEDLERRAVQLETSAVVAKEAAEIHDLPQLLNRVVHLISERFEFYHTGIFMLDERGEYAVLQAADSDGGQRMLERGHKLQVGKVGVVGYAAGMNEPRIAQDVGADVVYYDNPDMPNTRSEMALPLVVRGKVIGVLDVQSTEANAFKREDLEVLQILADQIALAIENTQLLQGSQKALAELEKLYGEQVAQAWKQRLSDREIIYQYNPVGSPLLKSEGESLVTEGDGSSHILTQDISFRGQSIGVIDLLREADDENWSEDEKALVEEILEQTALALENARLVDQIQLRSDQIQLLQEITALSSTLMSETEMLFSVTQKLFTALNLLDCTVVLFDEDKTQGEITAKASATDELPALGSLLEFKGDEIVFELMSKKEILILEDVKNDSRTSRFTNAFSHQSTYTIVVLPLIVRGEVIGMINLDIEDPEREIDAEDFNLFTQIRAQISSALDSSRLFTAEQQGRVAGVALLEISQIASSSLDLNQVLQEITQRSASAIQAHRCTVSLLDKETNTIKHLMSRFSDPDHEDKELWEIFIKTEPLSLAESPVYQKVFKDQEPIIHDITEQPGLIPARWTEPFGLTKVLLLPLISQDEVYGILTFDHVDPDKGFSSDQVELAQTIAGQIASTIENANLFEQTFKRAERERLVTNITTKIRASNDPREILQTALIELQQALKKPDLEAILQSDSKNEEIQRPDNNGQEGP